MTNLENAMDTNYQLQFDDINSAINEIGRDICDTHIKARMRVMTGTKLIVSELKKIILVRTRNLQNAKNSYAAVENSLQSFARIKHIYICNRFSIKLKKRLAITRRENELNQVIKHLEYVSIMRLATRCEINRLRAELKNYE